MRWLSPSPKAQVENEEHRHGPRNLDYDSYHPTNYNPFRRNRTADLRDDANRDDLEGPPAQRSSGHLVPSRKDSEEARQSRDLFPRAKSGLAVLETRKEGQSYAADYEQHTQGTLPDIQQQLNSYTYDPVRKRVHLMRRRGIFRPSDEENLEEVLHNSIKNNKPLATQTGLTGLARIAHSFGLAIDRDIKAPLAEIGVSSIINGPLLKSARKESISIIRYGRESDSNDGNIVKCRSGALLQLITR